MGEEISEELEELEAQARDEAIKQMLKAWQERPEEKRGSWGPIFGHGAISGNFWNHHVLVALAKESTMAVTAHAMGEQYSSIAQLSPGNNNTFHSIKHKIKGVTVTGLGSGDRYAFGFWEPY